MTVSQEDFDQLESEVATLQDGFAALQAVVERLERRIDDLQGGNDPSKDAFVQGVEDGTVPRNMPGQVQRTEPTQATYDRPQ